MSPWTHTRKEGPTVPCTVLLYLSANGRARRIARPGVFGRSGMRISSILCYLLRRPRILV
jgi:hypothetical protein